MVVEWAVGPNSDLISFSGQSGGDFFGTRAMEMSTKNPGSTGHNFFVILIDTNPASASFRIPLRRNKIRSSGPYRYQIASNPIGTPVETDGFHKYY